MQPRSEETAARERERDPAKPRKLKRPEEGAGAAGAAQPKGGTPSNRQAEKMVRGREGSSNDAVMRQRPNGCSQAVASPGLEGEEEEEEEEQISQEQGERPSRDGSGWSGDGRLFARGREAAALKRAGAAVAQPPTEEKCRSEHALMGELSEMVYRVVKSSSWWERHGVDDTIIALNFLVLPIGFLLLRSNNPFVFLLGIAILGVAHHTITVKASHLASHNALVESKSLGKLLTIFFIEVCSAFTAERGSYNHVKLHHGYTNVIGLGDSSTWKLPFLNRYVYMFLAPIAVPIITPLVAIGLLTEVELKTAIRTLSCIIFGLYAHYWLLLNISGFQSPWSALTCMLITRSLLAHPYIHVNIFQHIGLPMFSADKKPKRIYMMSSGVLNLPRNPLLLDWAFGHSLISCHVEHHLFPAISDNMCLKIKPVVSQYLKEKKLRYNEDSYWSRLKLFLDRYEELMVHAPPISELVGIQ